ncbi:MAG: RDD family protein [Helicobacter sp.]|nr:RDD family protein [Helicobacter sp.]
MERKRKRHNHKEPPKQQLHQAYKAGYLQRFMAQIIDSFMIYTPILYIATYIFMQGKEAFLNSEIAPAVSVALYGILSALFVSLWTQTPGNKAQGIAVVSRIGEKIGFLHALVRFALFIASALLLWGIFVPYLWRERTTLHDWLCGTIVIRKP